MGLEVQDGKPLANIAPLGPLNLKAERRRRGLSIRAAAALIGVTPKVLFGAEKGRVPLPKSALKIATYYGVDVVVQWPDEDDVPAEVAA